MLTANPELSGYSQERTREFYDEWLRRARLVPGISAVSLASVTAMSGSMFAGAVSVPDAEPRNGSEPNNNFNVVTPDYFQTIGMPVLAGRTFTERDDANAPAVAIVNDRFVEYYWPGRSPLGRQMTVFRKSVEIVGLVRTAKYSEIREDPQITIYFPAAQRPVRELTLHARVAGSTTAATAGLMETVRRIDPRVPIYNVGVLEDHVNARLANERVLNVLSILFASLALLVACAGLSGLVAYAVVRRTREIGIRLAIGAQRRDILRLFVKDIVVFVGIGVAIGMPLSLVVAGNSAVCCTVLKPRIFLHSCSRPCFSRPSQSSPRAFLRHGPREWIRLAPYGSSREQNTPQFLSKAVQLQASDLASATALTETIRRIG